MRLIYSPQHIDHKAITASILTIIFLATGILSAHAQAPTIASFSPTTICQGDVVTINGTNFTGTTVVKVGTANAASFNVNSATSITAVVSFSAATGSVEVVTPNGTATSPGNLTINAAPQPKLTDQTIGRFSDFANCSGSVTYTLTVENNSVPAGGSCNYDIDWGDNTQHFTQTDWQVGSQTTHPYQAQGYFKIILTITPASGCKKTASYNFYSGGNPAGGFGSDKPTVNLCAPATLSFKITGQWYNNTPGTYYYIDWGDNSDTTLQHPLNSTNTDQIVTHTYTKTPCPDSTFFAVTFKAANGCIPSSGGWKPIGIGIKPTASFKLGQTTICINDPICPVNNSSDGYSGSTLSCTSSTGYNWDFGNGSTSSSTNPVCFTYNKAGNYKIKLSATSSCGTDDTTETITVWDISSLPTVTSPVTYCQNAAPSTLTATGTNLLWYTSAMGGTGSATAPTPATNVPGTFTYYVSQTASNSCESPRVPVTVTINAAPAAPTANTPVELCQGQTATSLSANGNNLLWYGSATGGTGNTAAPIPSTTSVGTTTYYVSQTVNTCEGPRTPIVVNVGTPPAAPVVIPSISYCQNQPASALTASGTNLLWYTTATGGTGNPAAPIPSTANVGTTTYYVSQSNGCGEGPRAAITVTVNSSPSATIAYGNTVLCNVQNDAANNNPPVPVILTGNKGGIFSVSPSNGLPVDAATGTVNPSGAMAGVYTITYTIAGTNGCTDFTTTAVVNISGTPDATIAYPPVCSSDVLVSVQLTGTLGGTFSSSPGLTLNAATGSITPSTSTPGTYTVTYTILPSPPCPGFTTKTNVVITQAPSATIAYNPANLCNISQFNNPVDVTLTGTTGGNFSVSPATGLTIDAATGRITPAGATAGFYTITYTVTGNGGCSIYQTTATVSVSSAPMAVINYPPICSSDKLVNVQLTGTNGGTFTSTTGLTIDAATGGITPATSTPGNYVVTYTIPASLPCPGFTTTTNIVITAAPSATITYGNAVLCNVENSATNPNPPVQVILTGSSGGNFSIAPSTGLMIDAATGTISPSGAIAGSYTITYAVAGAGGCANFNTTTVVTVNSAPTAAINYPASPYCRNISNPQPVSFSGNSGGSFSSTSGLSIDAATGAINPSLSAGGTYIVTYTIPASPPCPGFTTTASVEIDEIPGVAFAVATQSICSGGTAVFTSSATVSNPVLNWSVAGTLPDGVSGITSGTVSGNNAGISLSFINNSLVSQTITIQVVPSLPNQSICAGAPFNLTLIVHPIPAALATDTVAFCMHDPATALTVAASAGNTINWYDQNGNILNAAPVINTISPAQFTYYASQISSFGCESGKSEILAVVHPVAKIIRASYTNPTICGIPSGSVVLNVLDLNDAPLTDIPLLVHYTKFQTAYQILDSTDATGKIVVPLTAGTYSDFYVETNGCASQKIPDVFVLNDPNPPAKPIAGYNMPLCSEDTLSLSALSPTSTQDGPIDYVWVGPAFGSFADTSRNTVVTFPSVKTSDAGVYIVYAIQNNCISPPNSFPVTIKQSPSKPQIITRNPLCIGDNLSLQAYSTIVGNNTLNYTWIGPNSGFLVNAPNAGITNVTIQDAGIYAVTVNSPQTGCSSTSDTLIGIGGYPVVQFARDTFTLPVGYLLKLAPAILNAADPHILPMQQFAWTPTQNLACNDAVCASPVVTIKNNVCYTVKATNIYGCSIQDTVCIKVFCQNSQVFIPNAFTPNGNLAENRKFMVRASGIASVKSFRVFNRWGQVAFERSNFPPNDPAFAWDGTLKGKLADTGVYIYIVEVICENGVPYSYKGDVTLF